MINRQPFFHRVRSELDAMERAIFVRSALAMLAGGLILAAMFWTIWILL